MILARGRNRLPRLWELRVRRYIYVRRYVRRYIRRYIRRYKKIHLMTLFRLHMVKQILPSGRIVSWSPWSSWNFCPRCDRAKICEDDLGLQETIYRPREELYITTVCWIEYNKLNSDCWPLRIQLLRLWKNKLAVAVFQGLSSPFYMYILTFAGIMPTIFKHVNDADSRWKM